MHTLEMRKWLDNVQASQPSARSHLAEALAIEVEEGGSTALTTTSTRDGTTPVVPHLTASLVHARVTCARGAGPGVPADYTPLCFFFIFSLLTTFVPRLS